MTKVYLVQSWDRTLDHESTVEAHSTIEGAQARVESLRAPDPEEDDCVYRVSGPVYVVS